MKSNNVLKAIAFDYGGVIELYEGAGPLRRTAELLNIPHTELRTVYHQYNHLANTGNLDWYSMFHKVLSAFNISNEKEEDVMRMLEKRFSESRMNSELLDLFPKLKKAGFKIGILSNWNSSLRAKLEQNGIATLVDTLVVSGEIGFQKPQPEAFQILFEQLGHSAGEVVYIDDSPASLAGAEKIGYTPILFKNNEQLKHELVRLGISV